MMERLDKILARRGVGSRADASRLCRRGRVAVGESIVRKASTKVDVNDEIYVDGELLEKIPTLICYHKPFGMHSTMRDPQGRPCLTDALPEYLLEQMHPVGRLDAETTGLLLFSQSGKLTQRLLHPKHAIEREYIAKVEGVVEDPEGLTATLAAGVLTADGTYGAKVVEVKGDQVRLIVTEGKHRMVRRILANSGYPVLELQRLRYGPFDLEILTPGEWREARDGELEELGIEG